MLVGISRTGSVRGPRPLSISSIVRSESQGLVTSPAPLGPIKRLPPEILEAIFLTLAESLFQDTQWDVKISCETVQDAKPPPIYSWVGLTEVCRSWRAIVMKCSPLWSHLLVGLIRSGRILLSRSQASLLTVRCLPPGHRRDLRAQFTYALNDVVNQAGRIGTLELKLDKSVSSDSYRSLCGRTRAHSLRTLRIHSDILYDNRTPCAGWSMPKLTSLEIRAPLATHWRPLLRGTLRHLSLESFRGGNSSINTLHDISDSLPLFDVLAELPRLQSLVLRLDAYTGTFSSGSARHVTLRDLRLLEIAGHLGHCVEILNYLTVPDDATITIDSSKNCFRRGTHHFGPRSNHSVVVLNGMLDSLMSTGAREPTAISLAVEENRVLRLRGWISRNTRTDATHNFENTDFKPVIDITLPCRESAADIERVLSLFSFNGVRSLHIGPMDLLGPFGAPSTVVVWFNIFSRLRDIIQLRISSLHDPVFWIGLLLPYDPTSASLRFPSLHTLELVDVTFRRPTTGTGLDNHRFSSASLRSNLTLMDLTGQPADFLRCLVARRKLGGHVRKLVVKRTSNLYSYDMLYLEAIEVADVIEWDGQEASVEGNARFVGDPIASDPLIFPEAREDSLLHTSPVDEEVRSGKIRRKRGHTVPSNGHDR